VRVGLCRVVQIVDDEPDHGRVRRLSLTPATLTSGDSESAERVCPTGSPSIDRRQVTGQDWVLEVFVLPTAEGALGRAGLAWRLLAGKTIGPDQCVCGQRRRTLAPGWPVFPVQSRREPQSPNAVSALPAGTISRPPPTDILIRTSAFCSSRPRVVDPAVPDHTRVPARAGTP